jgi:hypothetical protein
MIRQIVKIILISFLVLSGGCVTEFIPDIEENAELVVVEGLITDRQEPQTIKISRSLPFGERSSALPLSGCFVTVSDDLGSKYVLSETASGIYTMPLSFRGAIGRFYTLHIKTGPSNKSLSYESFPVEMKPVPAIDSIYYDKVIIQEKTGDFFGIDACKIYLNTYDPGNICRYYRWDFTETWILRLLWPVDNIKCWVNDRSHDIILKSTAAFDDSRIVGQPVTYIDNETDRLSRKYSIEVNQYSLNEDEFNYLEKIKNLNAGVGGLYDKIPASIPNNLICIDDPKEKVLGYFSVSAKSSKRIFIEGDFRGIIDHYDKCPVDTIYGDYDPPELYLTLWPILDHPADFGSPRIRILTDDRGCADCTVRGTKVKPAFWIGE